MATGGKYHQPCSPRSVPEICENISPQYTTQYTYIPDGRPTTASSHALPTPKDVNGHYEGIERQFEQLRDTLYSRTLASLRPFRSGNDSKENNGHVDVVEAVFSKHRYQMSARSLSPISPYNEDIADRNIMAQYFPQVKNRYSQLMPNSYQEDVADRNIVRSRSNPIYKGPRSKHLPTKNPSKPCARIERSILKPRSSPEPRTNMSINGQRNDRDENKLERDLTVDNKRMSLRPQASAPNLGMSEVKTPDLASFPRPPTASGVVGGSEEEHKASELPLVTNEPPMVITDKSASSQASEAKSTSKFSRASGKKNVRDLSIDTGITSVKKPSIRIEHYSVQPPAPINHAEGSKNASIDEIVHSPLPTVSPNKFTPQPSPVPDLDEIMKLLKQAYMSNAQISPQYPTFESLQEIIVREINSHAAFRRIPLPLEELPFTPPNSDNSVDDILLPPPGPSRVKPFPLEKESTLVRLMRRRSNLANGGKDSSLLDNISGNSLSKETKPTFIPRRRRHTFGEPLTPSMIFTTAESQSQLQPQPQPQPQPQQQPQPQPQPSQKPSIINHTSTGSTSSSFSIFPQVKTPVQPRYKSHFKRKSDPVPPSPHFKGVISADATTPPIFPSYVRK